NRDGHLDIVTQHLVTRLVNVQLGDGTGRFAPPARGPLILQQEPGAIALGDLDGDNILDLAIASRSHEAESVTVFFGEGDGCFRLTGSTYPLRSAADLYKPIIHVVDVNEDGRPDIVVSNGRRNSIELLLGDGHGKFIAGPHTGLEAGPDNCSFGCG